MNQSFIHKNAIVETTNIGENTHIWAFTHILKDAIIGNNNNICDHCFIENKVITGDNVTVKCGVYLWDGITIEDNVFIGPSATFTNDLLPRSKNAQYIQKNTLLKYGCSIGANATILPGITIGKYAMVGAGAVVTKTIDDYALVYGNPAIPHGHVCSCGEKLFFDNNQASCGCKNTYKLVDGKVVPNL